MPWPGAWRARGPRCERDAGPDPRQPDLAACLGLLRLRLRSRLSFGPHYAETLRRWDLAVRDRADEVRALGFDETFQRMWHFYLEYSRAGFAAGYIDVQQLTFSRDEVS